MNNVLIKNKNIKKNLNCFISILFYKILKIKVTGCLSVPKYLTNR